MPKLSIERSVSIEAPVSEVYSIVRDFKRWPEWSPWLSAERDAQLTFSDDGTSYAWDGAIVGSGNMSLVDKGENKFLKMRLALIKPWKSQSDVSFTFEEDSGSTRVTWRMDGSLPFFLFFMKPMMETLIAMDYERGLGMLKDLLELESVPSVIELHPGRKHDGCRYIGIVRNCSMADMPDCMSTDFAALKQFFCEGEMVPSGPAFSIYSKWDLNKRAVEYTACFPFEGNQTDLPDSFVCRELPAVSAYVIKHIGAYRHLGNAWSAGMIRARQKLFKQNKKVYPFEVYVTEIDTVPDQEIVTEIYFPKA